VGEIGHVPEAALGHVVPDLHPDLHGRCAQGTPTSALPCDGYEQSQSSPTEHAGTEADTGVDVPDGEVGFGRHAPSVAHWRPRVKARVMHRAWVFHERPPMCWFGETQHRAVRERRSGLE